MRLFFSKARKLFLAGVRHNLPWETLIDLPQSQKVETVTSGFWPLWKEELQKDNPSFARAVFWYICPNWLFSMAIDLFFQLLTLVMPIMIPYLTKWCGDPDRDSSEGFVYFGFCFAASFIIGFLRPHAIMILTTEALKVRTVITQLVYDKVMKLGNAGLSDTGKISNLISADAQVFIDTCISFNLGLIAPLYVIACAVCLYVQIGYYCFIAVTISFLFLPVTIFFGAYITRFNEKLLHYADMRLGYLNELLDSIRVIKYYGWESPFIERINNTREKELLHYRNFGLSRSVLIGTMILTTPFNLLATLIGLSIGNGEITSGNIFSALSFISLLRNPYMFLAFDFSFYKQWMVCLHRIQNFVVKKDIPRVRPTINDDPTPCPFDQPKGEIISLPPSNLVAKSSSVDHEQEIKKPVPSKLSVNANKSQSSQQSETKSETLENQEFLSSTGLFSSSPINTLSSLTHKPLSERVDISLRNALLSYPYINEQYEKPVQREQKDQEEQGITPNIGMLALNGQKVSIDVRHGELLMIVGPVGCGKSTLAQALLGELTIVEGSFEYTRDVAYVPQRAWIMNASIRDNILCGRLYDEEKYQRVISDCALVSDLNGLPKGDQTELGERGVTLSGGQKQRISIARAVYSGRGIIVLDDPLSAVDAKVCTHIFSQCVMGALRNRTRVMVTNQLHLLAQADRIIVLNKNNTIALWGTYVDVLASKTDLSKYIRGSKKEEEEKKKKKKRLKKGDQSGIEENKVDDLGDQSAGSLVQMENKEEGSVGFDVYVKYCISGGKWFFSLIILCALVKLGGKIVEPIWLSYWTKAADEGDSRNTYYLTGMGISCFVDILFSVLMLVLWVLYGVRSSRALHGNLIKRVVSAMTTYFDVTPLGRLVNRFSKDMRQIDFKIPMQCEQYLGQMTFLIACLVVIMTTVWWMFLIILPIIGFYYFFQLKFRLCFIELQRFDSISRSPVFINIDQSIGGISSIRVYNLEDRFVATFNSQVDENTKATYNMLYSKMWFSQRLDWLAVTINTIFLIILCVPRALDNPVIPANSAAMALSNLASIASLLSMATQNASETETTMQSVERIIESTNIEREEENEETRRLDNKQKLKAEKKRAKMNLKKEKSISKEKKDIELNETKKNTEEREEEEEDVIVKPLIHKHPPKDWPRKGTVKFVDYKMKYRPGLPLVLRGLNFSVNHGEKIGVVGRTGSGKSTMMVALYRIVEGYSGHIEIDGVDISTLYLHDLRSKLAIVPQEPAMFSGTLRFNLDPLNEHTDEEIWHALDLAALTDLVKKEGGLEAEVAQSGSNFSTGERQLLCMARAVLRNAKILIMDEATASVDLKTDIMIQQMARRAFTDCTVFTIAHRLHTIMDSDRILVMNFGEVAEFDTPLKLLDRTDSTLHALAQEAGLSMLRKLAEGKIDIKESLTKEAKKKKKSKKKLKNEKDQR